MPKKEKVSPEDQLAFEKAYEEFQALTLGKKNMDLKEADQLRDYILKRTDMTKDEDQLTPDERAWKQIYGFVDDELERALGSDAKKQIDDLKEERDKIEKMSDSIQSLVLIGREIEENLSKQWAYISYNFNEEDNRFRQEEIKLSDAMVAVDTPNEERVVIAKDILELVKTYKEALFDPINNLLDDIHESVSRFEKKYNSTVFELKDDESAGLAKASFSEWLELTKKVYQARVKTVAALSRQFETDVFIPKFVIEHGGDSVNHLPSKEITDLLATFAALQEVGYRDEIEVSQRRNEISIGLFGKQEDYIKIEKQVSSSSEVVEPLALTNPLEGKAWYRLVKVIYIGVYVLLGLVVLLLLMSGDYGSFEELFWAIVIGIGVLEAIKMSFYYITIGKTSWK